MIPKIIHQCLFGDRPYSDLNRKCFDSWQKVLPDWVIFHWTLGNLPVDIANHPWVRGALATAPPHVAGSNLFSYITWELLHRFGGVKMDNDLELLKPFPIDLDCFLGWQGPLEVNAAIAGSVPGHWLPQAITQEALNHPPNCYPLDVGPPLWTKVLLDHGLKRDGSEQTVEGVKVYSSEKAYPWGWDVPPERQIVAPSTFAIHWWEGSWNK